MARRHGLEQFLEPRNVNGSSRALRRKGENTKKKATTSNDITQYRFPSNILLVRKIGAGAGTSAYIHQSMGGL